MIFCAVAGYDNNTPYDCKFAGEKQGEPIAIRRGMQSLMRFAKKKEIISDDAISAYPTSPMLGEYQNDCLS